MDVARYLYHHRFGRFAYLFFSKTPNYTFMYFTICTVIYTIRSTFADTVEPRLNIPGL